jgi:Flp pilus assembly pilin Flp
MGERIVGILRDENVATAREYGLIVAAIGIASL